jgi:hypothetical protein
MAALEALRKTILGFAKARMQKRQEQVKTEEEEGGLYTVTTVKKCSPHSSLNAG